MKRHLSVFVIMASLLVGCSGDKTETTAPTPGASQSVTAAPGVPTPGASPPSSTLPAAPSANVEVEPVHLPTDGALVAALLTPDDLGSGFTGGTPVIERIGATDADEPVCGIARTSSWLAAVSAGQMVSSEGNEQVRQRLSVSSDAEADLVVTRGRSAARCTYEEVAGEISSVVEVRGPVDLTGVAADSAGFARTYSGGYEWDRWDMDVRNGRILIHVEYTSALPVDAARARQILSKAVERASHLQ